MALADEENQQLLERDCGYACGTPSRGWTPRSARSSSTAPRTGARPRSYAEMWRRWIYALLPQHLVPAGEVRAEDPHDLIEEAWNQIWNKGYVHEVAQFFATGGSPTLADRPDDGQDFEWFE